MNEDRSRNESCTRTKYSYDAVGNRVSSLNVSSYSYNNSNELTSSSDGYSYTYDFNGNMLSKADSSGATQYAWDFENRLASVTLPSGGGTVNFKYDSSGRRIQKSGPNGTTNYLYDGNNLIEGLDGNGIVVARYIQTMEIDEPISTLVGGSVSFYNVDGLGSVTSLSNAQAASVETYTFDSFGKRIGSSGSLTNPMQYSGREFDSETGLIFLRARYYEPNSGRYLSQDPVEFVGGENFYSYVGNDPIGFIDPLGLIKKCTTKVMLVTAYSDRGPGKDWPYFAPKRKGEPPRSVGWGTVAVANTNPQPYPFGATVYVSGPLVDPVWNPQPVDPFNWPSYTGEVHDTGAGWNRLHHHVPPDDWIDIWLPTESAARKWGIKWRQVTICYEYACP